MAVTNTVGGGVPDAPEKKRQQEKATVGLMIELYCRGHHGTPKGRLCPDCAVLRDYADARVDHCPHIATKTFCSVCQTHCYKPEMRERIRQVEVRGLIKLKRSSPSPDERGAALLQPGRDDDAN